MSVQFFGGNQLLDADKILKKAEIYEGMNVADLGCGAKGHFVFPATRFVGNDGLVYAVDIRKSALDHISAIAKLEGIKHLQLVQANLEKYGSTDIPQLSLDVVLLINILFQSRKQFDIIKESLRLLKKGGRLVIVDWKASSKSKLGPPPEFRVNKSDIIGFLHALGVEEVSEFDAGKFHFGMIFEK